jgi:hypothetical protein
MRMKWMLAALVFGGLSVPPWWSLAQPQRGQGVRIKVKTGQEIDLYEESHALLIGVSSYDNGWSRLRGVDDDIPEVRKALERQGFAVEELRDPTRREFREKLDEFIDKYGLSTGNRLLIYFAGHGHTMKAEDGRDLGYVVMRDAPLPGANVMQFQQRAISMDEVEVYARRVVSKHAMFIFDSCFGAAEWPHPDSLHQRDGDQTGAAVHHFGRR